MGTDAEYNEWAKRFYAENKEYLEYMLRFGGCLDKLLVEFVIAHAKKD